MMMYGETTGSILLAGGVLLLVSTIAIGILYTLATVFGKLLEGFLTVTLWVAVRVGMVIGLIAVATSLSWILGLAYMLYMMETGK